MKNTIFVYQYGPLIATHKQSLYSEVIYWLSKISRETDFDLVMVSNKQAQSNTELEEQLTSVIESERITVTLTDSLPVNENNALIISEMDGALIMTTNDNHTVLTSGTWEKIYDFLKGGPRRVVHERKTKETEIVIELNLDGSGQAEISTGLNFLNHMLEQIARHGNVDLKITAKGDLHIDEHHTIEDTAITLGEALNIALGDKRGIERYGFYLPMDDALAAVAIDFGGRSWLEWQVDFKREKIGDVPTEMFFHFFKSLSDSARCNLNIKAEGINEHHKIEAVFKAFAKALKAAIKRDVNNMNLPSTKGIL